MNVETTDTAAAEAAHSFKYVRPEDLEGVWLTLSPMIERALKHGDDMTLEDVKREVFDREIGLLVEENLNAVLGYRVVTTPTQKVLWILFLSGEDAKTWAGELEEIIAKIKKEVGADSIQASCRDGMAKRLGDRGWKRKEVIMEHSIG